MRYNALNFLSMNDCNNPFLSMNGRLTTLNLQSLFEEQSYTLIIYTLYNEFALNFLSMNDSNNPFLSMNQRLTTLNLQSLLHLKSNPTLYII